MSVNDSIYNILKYKKNGYAAVCQENINDIAWKYIIVFQGFDLTVRISAWSLLTHLKHGAFKWESRHRGNGQMVLDMFPFDKLLILACWDVGHYEW